MAAGDVFDTTLADSPPTTYGDPVYGTPDFARYIPTDVLDQIGRDQQANAWAEEQRGKIADIWGNYVKQNMDETLQKYTSMSPVEGTSLPVDHPTPPVIPEQMDPGVQDQAAVPTGPELGPPQPTMQEHGQNFVQGMLAALQQAQGPPAAPIPENRAGLPGENPLEKLQAGFQRTGAAVGDLVHPQPGIGNVISDIEGRAGREEPPVERPEL